MSNSIGRGLARVALLVAIVLSLTAPAAAQGAVGVILMHGKQSSPNTPGLRDIASKAESAGMKVVVPSMPWGSGGWEKISVTPDQVFAMIDGYANQLRAQAPGASSSADRASAPTWRWAMRCPARTSPAWSWPHPAIRPAVPIAAIPRSRIRSTSRPSW